MAEHVYNLLPKDCRLPVINCKFRKKEKKKKMYFLQIFQKSLSHNDFFCKLWARYFEIQITDCNENRGGFK